ncbi:shikimate kinase [Sulfobacillus harzensis]|uniref:Shikimate kinase n=1 Tax=Sulfobacillus harzensis TaxID=2729629 RepID=A0A7Y0L1A4_9FIRM|nr:shikimate kinase [Sulfobacillus harzensis]NMP21172.1 hypothetical protein [Sulfobacillus harzensis]
MSKSSSRLALIGMMGAGKSRVAELVGQHASVPAWDLDVLIEREQGFRIAEIFQRRGEAYFRELEQRTLAGLSLRPGPFVLALGGGASVHPQSQKILTSHFAVVWLDAPAEVLYQRAYGPDRPLAARGASFFETLANERRPIYEGLADWRVDVASIPAEKVAACILSWWRGAADA